MDAQPEASSSTAPPPVVHHATLVFDSGISRERFTQLVEQNGVVHKVVQRLMQKSGNNEQSLRLGLVITAQDAPYGDSRKLHPVTPAYQQDFRRPSAFLTSLPSLARQFTPQAALAPPKPGAIIADVWDIEDGGGLSITSSEPGPSDYFLSSLVAGLELLDHYSAPSWGAPPTALTQMTPDSGLPMLSMLYTQPRSEASSDSRKQYLVVFTDKASLANMDAHSRLSEPWAREDSSSAYDTVSWDTIGARCKAKDVACSSVILGAPDGAPRPSAPLGREGSTAEKLRKMCRESSGEDNPDPTWFTLPPDSDAFFTGMAVKSTALPAAVPAPTAAAEVKPEPTSATTAQPPAAANGPSEAQIKYQMAQKQAMSLKMAQAAQSGGAQGNNSFQVLAQLISAGRLDPNAMAQLASSVRSDDPSTREKAMSQLAALVNQAQNRQAQAGLGANGGANNISPIAPTNNNASSSNVPGAQAVTAPGPQQGFPGANNNATNAAGANSQQAQFLAAMAARQQAIQAQATAAQQRNNPAQGGMAQTQLNNLLANQQTSAQQNPQQSPQQQLQNQQQALLLQRQQQLAAQTQNQQQNQQSNNTNMPQQGPQRTQIWSGNISLMIRGTPHLIPVNCSLLAQNINIADLQLASWPRNLEVSQSLQPMPISELQAFIKQNQPPCVLFSASPQADPEAIQKMGLLASSLSGRQAAAQIKFGSPGCGILLVSANRGVQPPDGNRILGVVCLKHPLPAPSNPAAANPNVAGVQQGQQQNPQQQQQQQQQATVSINGPAPSSNAAHQFQANMTGANLPQFLQHAQLLQQQQNQASASPQHARTPSQQHAQLGQGAQGGHQRVPSNQLPSTLQQFANQPNIQTIQQLQMRQLQAQAQQLQPNLPNQGAAQAQQQQAQPQLNQQASAQLAQAQANGGVGGAGVRPPQGNNITFTAQQKAGIIKLLRDVNINVSDSFDPNLIPRENLTMIINQAKERARQQQQQGAMGGKPVNPAAGGMGLAGGANTAGAGNAGSMGGMAGSQPTTNAAGVGQGGMQMPAVNAGAGNYNFAGMGNFGQGGMGGTGLTMAQLQGMQAGAAAGAGGAGAGGLGGLGGVGGVGGVGGQQPNPLAGLQNLGGFNLQQFQQAQGQGQGQGGGALGLFAQQGLNSQMLSQFQQQH